MGFNLFLALQVVAAPEQVSTLAAEVPVAEAASETQAEQQPQRKRVCRNQLDTRTGIMTKPRKVCRFVEVTENEKK